VVVGDKSKWARRKVGLADLVDEPWIMTPLDALGDSFVAGAFRKRGLEPPSLIITTFSIHLRNNLVGNGEFITALPRSVLRIYRSAHVLRELPIDLSVQPPVAIVTLRNRTLTPGSSYSSNALAKLRNLSFVESDRAKPEVTSSVTTSGKTSNAFSLMLR
jgi:DNA-binding transcriptional LysR family regulator